MFELFDVRILCYIWKAVLSREMIGKILKNSNLTAIITRTGASFEKKDQISGVTYAVVSLVFKIVLIGQCQPLSPSQYLKKWQIIKKRPLKYERQPDNFRGYPRGYTYTWFRIEKVENLFLLFTIFFYVSINKWQAKIDDTSKSHIFYFCYMTYLKLHSLPKLK